MQMEGALCPGGTVFLGTFMCCRRFSASHLSEKDRPALPGIRGPAILQRCLAVITKLSSFLSKSELDQARGTRSFNQ